MLGQRGSLPQRGFAVDGDPPRSQPAAKLLLLKKIQLKENIASYSQPRSYGSGYWPVIALLASIEIQLQRISDHKPPSGCRRHHGYLHHGQFILWPALLRSWTLINGGDLNGRVRSVMTIRLERTSALGKLVLTSQCIGVLAGPIFIGALNAPRTGVMSGLATNQPRCAGATVAIDPPEQGGTTPNV